MTSYYSLTMLLYYSVAPTGAPSNFVVNITTQNSVSLSWNPPPIDQQNGLIRYYVITCSTAGSSTVINWTSNTTELTIQNLQPYSQYSCTVAAFTIAIGPASIQLNFTLPEAGESGISFSSNFVCNSNPNKCMNMVRTMIQIV